MGQASPCLVGRKRMEGGVMAAHLTDRQKKLIIADYVELGSYNAVAKKYGITHQTVKRVVCESPEISEKLQHKNEQNTADIIAYMESQRGDVCEILNIGLAELKNPEKFKRATAPQVATTLAILIDKYTAFGGALPNGEKEDGLSKSLRELGEELESDEA